jgi:uncharacterized protein (TIGR02001 family)
MKSMGLKVLLAAATLATLGATNASADPVTVLGGTLSGYVALQSDYRFRGISQNDQQPSEQASLNWAGPDGFYAGTWVSKVNWIGFYGNPTVEVDLYGGKHFDLGGTDLNIEAYYYAYPDANKLALGPKAASYYETIAQLSHTFGPIALTLTGSNSPEWSLGGGTGWYVEGTAAYTVNDWLSISGNIGHQWVQAAPSDYTHYDIGATATWHSFALDARYLSTDIGSANCGFWMGTGPDACKGGASITLTYNFQSFPW